MKYLLFILMIFAIVAGHAQSNDAKVAYNKGLTYFNQKNYDYAIPHLEEAVAEDENFEAAYHLLAICFEEKKEYGKAINYYNRVIEINPKDEKSMFNVAQLYIEHKNYDSAKVMLESSLLVNPDYARAKIALADLTKRIAGGSQYVDPALENATYYEANQLYKDGKYNDALNVVVGLNNQAPSAACYYLEGICHQKLGDLNEALVAYSNTIKLNKDHNDAHINIGVIYYNMNNYNLASTAFSKVISMEEEPSEEFNYYLGNSYYNINQTENAEYYLLTAVEVDPNSGRAHYLLSKVYSGQGKLAKSVIHKNRAIELGYISTLENEKQKDVMKTVTNPGVLQVEGSSSSYEKTQGTGVSGTMPTGVKTVNEMYEESGVIPPKQRKAEKKARKAKKRKNKTAG